MPSSTHDPHGGGRPRLIFAFGGTATAGSEQRQFDLLPGVTTIGSSIDADLSLEGLDEQHAEIRRDERDEYVYVDLGSRARSRVDGQPVGERQLHTGDRINLGDWTVSFYREEFADHGRPEGGREGGQPIETANQEPRPRGTSPEGGSEPSGSDPGEYY